MLGFLASFHSKGHPVPMIGVKNVSSGKLEFPPELWTKIIARHCPPKHVQKNLIAFAKGVEEGCRL
jgi:hypothetical protein